MPKGGQNVVAGFSRVQFLSFRFIQPFPAGEAGLDIMPVLDGLLTEPRAQVSEAALPDVRKIAKTFVDILEHDTHILNLMDQKHEVGNGLDVDDTEFAETVIRRLVTSLLNFRMKLLDPLPLLVDFLENGSKLGNQGLRFGECKDPVLHGQCSSHFSASIAAMQPVPAAVMACRKTGS